VQINLCRLHTKLSSFSDAVSVVAPVRVDNPDVRAFMFQAPKCLITMSYCAGFSLLMQQQYSRAVDVLSVPLRSENRSHMMYGATSAGRGFAFAAYLPIHTTSTFHAEEVH
jgi:hypothetical protein